MNQSYFYLKMKEHKLKVPYTGKERRVRVLLPKDYEKDTDRSYPVVYFHDGQNVFYSKESFIGHSWKIIPAIKRNPDISRMIVVAIDNDGMGRMNEYAAWKFQESPIPGQQLVVRVWSMPSLSWRWSNLLSMRPTVPNLTASIRL